MKNTDTTKHFSDILEDLLQDVKDENKNLRTVAKEIGISPAALSKYRNDASEAGINNLVKIAKYFNLSTDYLLGLTEAPTTDKDLRYIIDYTGLSFKAVNHLHSEKTEGQLDHLTTVINKLCSLGDYIEFIHSLYFYLFSNSVKFLSNCDATDIFDKNFNPEIFESQQSVSYSVFDNESITTHFQKIDGSFLESFLMTSVTESLRKLKSDIIE